MKISEFEQFKLPPQSVEAEQSILGSLLIDREAIHSIADLLFIKDFYLPKHAVIYSAILDLYEKGEPIDLVSLSNKLKELGKLDETGGTSYLSELINSVPSAAHAASYAKIVKHKRVLRDLISAAQHINGLGYNENEDMDMLLDEAERKIFAISQESLRQDFIPVKSALEEAFERIDRLHKGDGALRGLATGFRDLDSILAGLQKSDLVILAAQTSIGKTSLALNIVQHVALHEKVPVGIFSIEMSREQLVDRLIASQAGVDVWKMRSGKLSSHGEFNDFERLSDALNALSGAPIFIDDSADINILQMRAMARRLQAEHGLGLLVIDYLQLMKPRTASDNMVQQITEISRSLKALARELNIPILALSQLSRAVEQRSPRIPRLSDLRESGSIEQDADVVMFIYREDRDKHTANPTHLADIHIAKHRNGPCGKITLYFDEAKTTFKNLDKTHTD